MTAERHPGGSDDRLASLILEYYRAVDEGRPVPPLAELQARHPDLAGELASFYADQYAGPAGVLRGLAGAECSARPEPGGGGADYPGLLDRETGSFHPIRGARIFLVGRSADAALPVRDLGCSRQQFRLVREGAGYVLEPLSRVSPTFCDGRPVRQRRPLRHGTAVGAGNSRFLYLERPWPPEGPAPAPAAAWAGPTVAARGGASAAEVIRVSGRFALVGTGPVLLGRDPRSADVLLPHPHVSRAHARLDLGPDGVSLTDLGSANGTFRNGRRVARAERLRPGDRIDVGPYTLAFTGDALVPRSRAGAAGLVASGLRRTVTDRATGKPLRLLDDVSLAVRPREFVCLIGPSGSGKSTLLAALSARAPADRGRVLLNGRDLYADFEALKGDLVVVPQKDVLFDPLTVEEMLTFTARLRLPPDTDAAERAAAVEAALASVGLTGRRHALVRQLSGGQARRAGLANELIGDPSLVFLDEVTSGLDEQTDREMMDLFSALADAGKTVVCVTHTLAHVERACHRVVVLAEGGRLAFAGPPAEARDYFGVARLGDLYGRLAERPPDEWRRAFEEFGGAPEETGEAPEAASTVVRQSPGAAAVARESFRQARILFRRNLAVLRGERAALAVMAGQTVCVAGALGLVFGDLSGAAQPGRARDAATLLFLLGVSSFWFGCNNAAKALVGDRPIYRRERAVNLHAGAYLAARFGVLALLGAAQALALAALVGLACRPPGLGAAAVGQLLALVLTGTATGLLISAVARTEETAVTLVPLVMIPQLIFADALARLSGVALGLARGLISCYWGNRALTADLPADVAVAAGLDRLAAAGPTAVVLMHLLALLAVTAGALLAQDRTVRRPTVRK
jgi:ABC-type multidrug transport system ATPase subunit